MKLVWPAREYLPGYIDALDIYFTYAAGRKYSTIAAPIDASTKPT